MEYIWTFLEGLASFVSPCTLPQMPVFAAYFAGSGDASSQCGGLESSATGRGSSAMLKTISADIIEDEVFKVIGDIITNEFFIQTISVDVCLFSQIKESMFRLNWPFRQIKK